VGAHARRSPSSSRCPGCRPRRGAGARTRHPAATARGRRGGSLTWRLTLACWTRSPAPATSCGRCPSPRCRCPSLPWGCRQAGDARPPFPGSCAPVARPTGVPCGRFPPAHPCFSASSHTLLSRASRARLHAAGFPEILDRNQEPVEISEPVDPASFSPQLEEADPLQGNEIILQFLALGRWDGSSLWCLLQADPSGLLG